MEKIEESITRQIKRLDNRLPAYMSNKVTEPHQLKLEIKRHKRQSIADRTRNFFIVMFILAIAALFVGKESYYYMGGIAFFAGLFLASPTARSARIVAYGQQKLFLLQLLQEMKKEQPALPLGNEEMSVGFE